MFGAQVVLRIGLGTVALAGVAAMTACGGGGGGGADTAGASGPANTPAPTVERNARVTIGDNIYQPVLSSISAGKSIDWVWEGSGTHSVVIKTPDGKEVKSPEQAKGTFSYKFETAGTYDYNCSIHGDRMQGRVQVSQ
ncbi:MAG: hypothetical protein IT302_01975 [Dehalococcoidia bacterium]|nr:hypothetical protein [Dehalococcoidia bacterium]